jgi:ubiquitin-protein ligase E3 C
VLTLPLLPNRLPLSSLTHFSANIPFSSTAILSPSIPQIASTLGVDAKVHLLANVAAFAPPRYHTLLFESFTALLHLLATVMSTLPARALERKLPTSVGKQVADSESDSDLEDSTNPTFVSRAPLPRLDDRTTKRLLTLPSTAHVSSLIHITKNHTAARIALCDFLLALCSAWPDRVDSILSTVIVSTGGGLVRELYRNSVRSSPLGKEVSLPMLLGMSSPFCRIRHMPTPFRCCKCRSLVPAALPDRFVHAFASHHGRRRVFFRTGRTNSP